ncbi:hypothetical protein CANMA_005241 [Candida margitis]|uniref:uncharacterized protein n=1 Tax=Candida margitis TaxID=1775924 RepID=UPI002225F16E|nr:uncharacterized protein CANMA_005241 [Candida margitis]KAI5950581.1 hypothetical protein CANMA_005241 [Candida margitis]
MSSDNNKTTTKTTSTDRTRSSSAVSNWKKQRYKQYQPRFLHNSSNGSIPLPSAECFQLDYILNNVLHNESEQVISDLLNVSTNYQNDLRQEIKHKLSTEQKIQFKNINICRETNHINSIIHQRRKKLKKAIASSNFGNVNDGSTHDEGEVNRLLKKSIETSDRLKDTISKLQKIEEKHRPGRESLVSIKREKYPHLYSLLRKESDSREHIGPVTNESANTISVESDPDTKNEHVLDKESHNGEVHGSQLEVPESPFLGKEESVTKPHSPKKDSKKPAFQEEDVMDPSEFELFMSTSIGKYRQQQSKSLKTIKAEEQTLDSSLTSFKSGGNPLNLLYSQLISNPKYLDQHQREQNASRYPFSSILSMKSAATIKSTQQSSHFKKLRINGSPLTSEHFRREREKLQRSEQSDEVLTAKMLEDLTLDCDDEATDENEDIWNSSGMNTEDEENFETENNRTDPYVRPNFGGDISDEVSSISSSELDSSDSDSSTDMINLQLASNYYTDLKKDLKQKRRAHRAKKSTKRRRAILQVKEMSPTPKHQPSHHILKPKSSILKTRTTSPLRQRSTLQNENLHNANEVYDQEISALSEVNNAYGSKTDNYISAFNANGTIILKHERHKADGGHEQVDDEFISDGEGSPRSISILKSFVQ